MLIDFAHFIKEWFAVLSAFAGFLYAGYRGIRTINDTLVSIKHELELSNDRLRESAEDRMNIWKHLTNDSRRIDKLELKTGRHDERIMTLFKKTKEL